MSSTSWARPLLLVVVALLVAGVVAVLACGPATVPERQSGGNGDVPESVSARETKAPFVLQRSGDAEKAAPTPTLGPRCKRLMNHITNEFDVVCPEPWPENIEHNLRRKYNDHMEEKAARLARSEPVEVVTMRFVILTSTEDAVGDVLAYLEGVETRGPVNWSKGGVHSKGRVSAIFSIELLPEVAAIEGVQRIKVQSEGVGQSSNLSETPESTLTPTLTPAEVVRIKQWHDAGVTGAGVRVGVIDTNFFGFRDVVAPNLS